MSDNDLAAIRNCRPRSAEITSAEPYTPTNTVKLADVSFVDRGFEPPPAPPTATERPFAYTAQNSCGDDYCIVTQTLTTLRTQTLPASIHAWLPSGKSVAVPREIWSEPNPPSRDVVLQFVRDRAAKIANAKAQGKAPGLWEAWGCLRCNSDDPEEKQVADYIASADWRWRSDIDEEWWNHA